jgi:hypothetical protein
VRRLALLLPCILSACITSIGHEKVPGWPELAVVEHYLPQRAMETRCARWANGLTPLACAEFDFAAARCDIFYSADRRPSPALVAHERLHCQGYDHAGESAMREQLVQWNRTMAARAISLR